MNKNKITMRGKPRKWYQDEYGYLRDCVLIPLIALCGILVLMAIAGIVIGIMYCVQGCFINKGHVGPHISDGVYEVKITQMAYPRAEDATFYIRGKIGEREYGIRADHSLGEQAWSQGEGGYMTLWVKNNHVIRYHVGRKGK